MENEDSFMFVPVRVTGGRKFRGDAYAVDADEREYYRGGYDVSPNGVMLGRWRNADRYTTVYGTTKVWDPATKRVSWVTSKFAQPREVEAGRVEADREDYARSTVEETLSWCRTKVADDKEARKFARNCLRKHHPELMKWVDEILPDERDVADEVERTLRWAVSLSPARRTSRSDLETSRVAYRALVKKGVSKLDGFRDVWAFFTSTMGLPDRGYWSEGQEEGACQGA